MDVPNLKQKVIVVGAGPVGALAAIYAATRGDIVEVYELRAGMFICPTCSLLFWVCLYIESAGQADL